MDVSCHRKLTFIFLTAILANLGATKPCLRATSLRYRHDVAASIRLRGGSQPAQTQALWVSCQDPASGRTYFYETNSRLTSWVLPPGAVLYGKLGSNGQLQSVQTSSSETNVQTTAVNKEESAVPVKTQDVKAAASTPSAPNQQETTSGEPWSTGQPAPVQEVTAGSAVESNNVPEPSIASQGGLQKETSHPIPEQHVPTQTNQQAASPLEKSSAGSVTHPSLAQPPVQPRVEQEQQKHSAVASQPSATASLVSQGNAQGAEHMESTSGGTWKETVDPVSGRKYFYNTVTRATSWHLPVENQLRGSSAGGMRNATFNLSSLARRFEDNLVNATRTVEGLWTRIGGLTKVFSTSKKPAEKPSDWYFDEEKKAWLKKNDSKSIYPETSEPINPAPGYQASVQQESMQTASPQAVPPHAPSDAQTSRQEVKMCRELLNLLTCLRSTMPPTVLGNNTLLPMAIRTGEQ
eukprot:759887-Hanusia_phi.AAC.4